MLEPNPIPRNRVPLVIGVSLVFLAGLIVAVLAVAGGSNQPAAVATPAPTPLPTPVASGLVDCSNAQWGPPLQPQNQPSDVHKYSAQPPMTIDTSKFYQLTITTKKGNIVLCLQPQVAPQTVNVIVTLARNHYYDGIPFHRVVCGDPNGQGCAQQISIIQGGDPNCIGNVSGSTCGQGGPGFQFKDEPVKGNYAAGTVAMANAGANTNGSQFFIDTGDNSTKLQKSYNLFGNVISGLDIAVKIQQGDVMLSVAVAQQQ